METLFEFFIKQHDGKLLLTGNLKQADVAGLNIQDSFTKEVIEMWSNLIHEENPTHFGNAPIWYNSLGRIANRPIFYPDWVRAGVKQAEDLLDQKFDILKNKDFKTHYKVNTTFLKVLWCSLLPGKNKKVFSGPGYDELRRPTHS